MFSFIRSSNPSFAIDLGTNNTLVYQPRKGIILEEPTSIAYDYNRRSFFDCGESSKRMVGKNPKYIEIMQPLSKGAISNLTVAKAYIKEVIARISRKRIFKPHIIVSVPSDLNAMERNAVIEAGREGGAKSVQLIKDPFAAALGTQCAIEQPQGVLVLDVGAGVSDISLLSLSGIVMSKSLRMAGNDLDEAIIEHFKATKRVLISPSDAERIKHELGNLVHPEALQMSISVKNLVTRLPETFTVNAIDVHQAILPVIDKIVALTHTMLSELPPVFASDIYDRGILLTGGSSMLKGLDTYLSSKLEIAVNPVENPLHNIILGAGRAIEEERYSKLFK
ncbi:rod shape-determining protein [Sulfurospirillum barnesii]|uniref:Cell shape-determining protein MreB n=1 Tax=Sulfurospirillum barnesii (strain ATCC 700032 / DSM 10660 / SES-3) TaxID=760154 RepID=I3Y0G6_SULBS|nr:rod shape-determining protein [Sulfurospirillum barnesii]AFL69690.1 actin-like ATPase involved in cell morphogenesis [Sulfurospirillum barnesii SES-3]